MKKAVIIFLGVFIILVSKGTERCLEACTLGVVNGDVTVDGRPILIKVRDTSDMQQLIHNSGSPYDYIGVRSEGNIIYMGLNEAGIASGNSVVNPSGLPNTNSSTQRYILRNYDSLDQIRDYFQLKVEPYSNSGRGCFPFIDAVGNASMFELNGPDWWLEYDSMDPDRKRQDLFGFVVRANGFHKRKDGTDDTRKRGRYYSATYNVSKLIKIKKLWIGTVLQGNKGKSSKGFEVVRYGPGRDLATLARGKKYKALSVIVVHGVAPGEDPALATMWVILGQPNYGIAVPAWVRVSNIPQCLSNGDMYDRVMSLFKKGKERTVQKRIFPVEAHMFNVVNNILLPHWRANGVPSVAEMTRIEHRMAADAYSLLACLDRRDRKNRAPNLGLNVYQKNLTASFTVRANDPDGKLVSIEWDFGDGQFSKKKSPSHTYDKPGTYLVSCTVTDDDGVTITDWKYLHFD